MRNNLRTAFTGVNPSKSHVVLDELTQANNLEVALECHHEVVAMCDEVERMSDIQVGLENLAIVAGSIEKSTAIELGLLDVASDLAVAGTGLNGAEVTPGLESSLDDTVSVESIKEAAANVWKTIVDFIKRIAKQVEMFFQKIFGALPRLKKSFLALKERADAATSKSIEEAKTELGSEVNALVVNNKAPATAKDIIATLEVNKSAVNALFDYYAKIMIARAEKIEEGLKDFNLSDDMKEADAKVSLSKVYEFPTVKDNEVVGDMKLTDVINDTRFDDGHKVRTGTLAGNMSVFLSFDEFKGGDDVLTLARKKRSRVYRVMSTFEKRKDALEDASIKTLSVADIKAICDVAIDTIDGIEAWERGKEIGNLKKAKDKAFAAGKKLDAALSKHGDLSSEVRAYPKSALEFITSLATWSSEPFTSITRNGLAAIRASATVCTKSLSNYK